MNCDRVQNENIIEKYLAGTLKPELKEAWEEHYFVCPECAQKLEIWQTVQGAIRDAAPAIRLEMRREEKKPLRVWIWTAGIAAAVVLGVFIGLPKPTAPVSRPPLLAVLTVNIDPPEYTPPVTRGVEGRSEALFRKAMESYLNRDWMGAIEGLRSSLVVDPEPAAPRFFLGASYLLAGNALAGVPELERVAGGDSPFAEEARFVLAHGYLMVGRRSDARALLQRIVEGQGDFARRAAALLRETAAPR